jgi:hypothetical protein
MTLLFWCWVLFLGLWGFCIGTAWWGGQWKEELFQFKQLLHQQKFL